MTDDHTARLTAALADSYRIERELGAGGMAVVYLAHDLKHERKVALKVLRPELGVVLGSDRFLAEIRTTAQLHHPHILPLLDSGAVDEQLFYVMPYVAGETLRARLQREGQLPIEDALTIAREVADALGAAHALGIVHRDIKPENILLQGGHALVADFGIALAVHQAGGERMTQTGLSLGTPQYMAPEQAMGEKGVDGRADIWALAAVLYEMLCGEPPYTGSTVQTIVAKMMSERPVPPRTMRDTVPSHIQAAVLRGLAKIPADRFATAERFAEALTRADLAYPPAEGVTAARRPAGRMRRSVFVAGTVVGAIVIAAVAFSLGRRTAAPLARWSSFVQLTDAAGVETAPSLSPDGTSFAYASNVRGGWDIYVQRVGGRNPVLVAGDSTLDEVWPAYSPNGEQIAYNLRGGGIFVVGATGESARRLTTFGANPAWSPNGTRIVFGTEEVVTAYSVNASGTLWTIDASGGEPEQLGSGDATGLYQPSWSPSGERIAVWAIKSGGQRDIETVAVSDGRRTRVTNDAAVDFAPTWSPDGRYLYYASDRGGTMGLWRIAVDEATGEAAGSPEPIVNGVDVELDLPAVSRDGNALVFRSKLESVNPAAIAFDPTTNRLGVVTPLLQRTGILTPYDVSRDGRWLALANAPGRRQDIFVMAADGSGLTRLTDDEAKDWSPRFTPDGTALTFHSGLGGKYDGWSILLDGSGRTRLTDLNSVVASAMFAPDGRRLAVGLIPAGGVIGEAPWPLNEQTATPLHLEVEGGTMIPTSWSRDGRWLSGYVVTPSGETNGMAVFDVEAARGRQLNRDSRTFELAWLPDSRRVIYFTDYGKLVVQDVESLERREVTGELPYPPNSIGNIVTAPDGRTLYYGAQQTQANIWLARLSMEDANRP